MLKGLYWNPLYDGEGFTFAEESGWGSGGHGDGPWGGGRVIAYFFTYDSGDQAWYLMDCQRLGDTISGKVYRTSGGEMGSNMNPDNVVEAEVGSVTFTVDGDKILFDARIEGRDVGYPLQPLFGTGVVPAPPNPDPEPDPPPDPDPEPEPPPEPDVVVEHKLGNTWMPLDVPVIGTIQGFSTTQIKNKKLVREYRITADQPLSLSSSVFNHDPAYDLKPSVQISGDNVRLYLGPVDISFPGLTKHASFKVQDSNLGLLIEVTAQVAG